MGGIYETQKTIYVSQVAHSKNKQTYLAEKDLEHGGCSLIL